MRDDQVGQLEPSSVLIAAEPEGGKLIEGAICVGYCYATVNLDVRSGQIQGSKIQTEPLAFPTVLPESK
jgi:hypothetical protein